MTGQLHYHGVYVAFIVFALLLVVVLAAAAWLEILQNRRSRR